MKLAEARRLQQALLKDFEDGYNDGTNGRPCAPPPDATSEYKYGHEAGTRERNNQRNT